MKSAIREKPVCTAIRINPQSAVQALKGLEATISKYSHAWKLRLCTCAPVCLCDYPPWKAPWNPHGSPVERPWN